MPLFLIQSSKMKKSFKAVALIIILSSAFFALQAQTYRIEAGYSQPRIYSSEISHRYLHGFQLGGTVEFDFFPEISFLTFQTGLSYSYSFGNNSQRYRYTSISDSIRINTQGHQLNIPVYAIASQTIFKVVKVSVFAGPNFNIGLSMPQRVETTITDAEGLQRLESFGYRLGTSDLYDGRLSRFNLQMDVGAGAQWWKMQVRGGYSFGINNLSKFDFHKQRQSGWFVSVAYEF